MASEITVREKELIAKLKFPLYKYVLDVIRDGKPAPVQIREIYQRNNSVAIILYNLERRTVILIRQFRLPALLGGIAGGHLTEACAGTMEDETPERAIIRETAEETGYHISNPVKIAECFVSPGSCAEKISLFIAPYSTENRLTTGGGLKQEGEDIEVIEVPFEELSIQMLRGEIADAKTLILLQHLEIHYFRSANI